MYQVKKRDGKLVDFDLSKITTALSKAFNAKQVNYTADILNTLALRVSADFSKKIKDDVINVGIFKIVPKSFLSSRDTLTWQRVIFFIVNKGKKFVISAQRWLTTKRLLTTI